MAPRTLAQLQSSTSDNLGQTCGHVSYCSDEKLGSADLCWFSLGEKRCPLQTSSSQSGGSLGKPSHLDLQKRLVPPRSPPFLCRLQSTHQLVSTRTEKPGSEAAGAGRGQGAEQRLSPPSAPSLQASHPPPSPKPWGCFKESNSHLVAPDPTQMALHMASSHPDEEAQRETKTHSSPAPGQAGSLTSKAPGNLTTGSFQ